MKNPNKFEQFIIRITKKQKQWLKDQAKLHEVSLSQIVRNLIDQQVNKMSDQ